MNIMDVSSLCRGCMKEVASWERDNFDAKAVDMFSFCTNIRITEEDNLPQQFCYDCVIKIESSYTFITEAQKVHVTLKNIISRSNTSIIIGPETSVKTPNSEMKLTLPDYKICSIIEDARPHLESIQNNPTNGDYVENFEECEPILENGVCNESNMEGKEAENPQDSNVCPLCRKSFTSKTWFSKHMQKEHTGKKYACEHCPKSFARQSQLTYHSVSHSEERKFACSACGKRFKRRKQLTSHSRAHADVRPYTCDLCSARFKTKSILKGHMAVHQKDKAFLCCFCGWSFAQAGNLKVHMRSHTGEKPYVCAVCPFRAAVASNLRRHERAHAPAHPHACHTCGKGFIDRSNLARHVRTHTGAVPYKCPAAACAAAFSDSWKRKAHLMRAHKVLLHDIPKMAMDGQVKQ